MYANAVEIVAKTEEGLPRIVVEALVGSIREDDPQSKCKENINNAMHTRSQNRNRYIRQEEI